jgi:hypothetical protein
MACCELMGCCGSAGACCCVAVAVAMLLLLLSLRPYGSSCRIKLPNKLLSSDKINEGPA